MSAPPRPMRCYSTRLRLTSVAAISLFIASALPAMADGEFFQGDYASGASSVVGSIVRGPVGASIGWSEFDDGNALKRFGFKLIHILRHEGSSSTLRE